MGRASSIHYYNKTLTGIKHKRSLIMALSKAWEARLTARDIARGEAWWDSLSEEERKKASGEMVTWVTYDETTPQQLPSSLRLATAAEIMFFNAPPRRQR